jgi:hypothetical protein
VESASEQCDELPYTQPDNCFAIQETSENRVTVATAAGSYFPAYYVLVGYPTRAFEGAEAAYAMRIVSGLWCALGIGLAAWALGQARVGIWGRFGFVAALTPVLVYTTVIPAPNSFEIVSGLVVWTGLLALARGEQKKWIQRMLVVLVVIAACGLAALRPLGPLWLGLVVLIAASFVGWRSTWGVVRRHARLLGVGIPFALGCAALGLWWAVNAGMTGPSEDLPSDWDGEWSFGWRPVRWVLQLVAAFPLRNEAAPPVVYLLYFLVVVPFLVLGATKARKGKRFAIVIAVAVSALLPMIFTWLTVQSQGTIWQGRYSLPFVVGVLVLCGCVLDDAGYLPRQRAAVVALGCAILATAHCVSIVVVQANEMRHDISRADPAWVTGPAWLVGGLVLAGLLLQWHATGLDHRVADASMGKGARGLDERREGVERVPR